MKPSLSEFLNCAIMKTQVSGPVSYYKQICHRCGEEAETLRSSWFNTDMLCLNCRQVEGNHPLYAYAQYAAFVKAQTGDYCFVGIGLPQELQRNYRAA
jgi:hypothetical protein